MPEADIRAFGHDPLVTGRGDLRASTAGGTVDGRDGRARQSAQSLQRFAHDHGQSQAMAFLCVIGEGFQVTTGNKGVSTAGDNQGSQILRMVSGFHGCGERIHGFPVESIANFRTVDGKRSYTVAIDAVFDSLGIRGITFHWASRRLNTARRRTLRLVSRLVKRRLDSSSVPRSSGIGHGW